MELSAQLRQDSHDLHGVAERSELMVSLLHGTLPRQEYTVWLLNLQAIYVALENGLARAEPLAGMDCKSLFRTSSIA
jgi:heme oxygenase